MSKGSIWNIWDLHLHTPFSVLNNGFGSPDVQSTWDKYVDLIEKKVKEKGIVALGVTDYFSIDGYKRLKIFQAEGRLENVLLIPNIEFRVDKIIYRTKANSEPKRINLHVLLSPSISDRDIEEGFLHDLDFVYENDPFELPKTKKLTRYSLEKFGSTLQKQHKKFQEKSALEIGCLTAVVQAEQIKSYLDQRFKGNYLLILANENLELMSWDGQDHAVRQQLIQMSHGLFSSFETDREFCLGQKHPTITDFIDEFKSLKPCLWGCDSHGYEERFLEPDLKRYCWIKGDATWEGLKQVIFEPDERVRIQEKNPEPDKSIYSISRIHIEPVQVNTALKMELFDSDLNWNLISIIGGRGSGKTALLDLISMCFSEGSKLKKIKDSFYHRLYVNDDLKTHITNLPIKTELSFKSAEQFEKSIGTDNVFFEKANILYLTQNHFEEYTNNPEKLNEYIVDLIFEKYLDDRLSYEGILSEVSDTEQRIQDINLECQQLLSEIEGKKEIVEIDLLQKSGQRADIQQRLVDIAQKESKNDDVLKQLSQKLESTRNRKRQINLLSLEIEEFSSLISSFNADYSAKVVELNSMFSQISNTLIPYPEQIVELEEIETNTALNNLEIIQVANSVDKELATSENEVNDLQGLDKQIADWHQKVNDINTEIQLLTDAISEIDDKANHIRELESERIEIFSEIVKKVIHLKQFLQKMIDKFENGQDEMLSRLKFSATIDLSKCKQNTENLLEKLNKQTFNEKDLTNSIIEKMKIIGTLMNCNEEEIESIDLHSPILDMINLVRDVKRKQATTESELFNAILTPFFGVGINVKFNNRELNSLSMGERAVVLLKILLALDDKPLLLDQPEEHLDNRYIYDELAPAFRSAKKRRQIIIATHNANLVVNTDAEQIIVAENNDGVISYKVGTLEDTNLRESIKQILEGGEEAFKKREEKYGLKF
jgi:ABC-type cobalamin/Fe3+-siderophores transport system ATPase subunit